MTSENGLVSSTSIACVCQLILACSLEFGNLQSLIYADLARNIGECKDEEAIQPAVDLIKSNVDVPSQRGEEATEDGTAKERVFMVRICFAS